MASSLTPTFAESPGSRNTKTSVLPITVLMNAGSGSNDKADARAAITDALRESGRDLEIHTARHPRDLPDLARRAADRRPGILAAAGGDGTLNAVAEVAWERNLPLGVIPLGTFNYFARDLGIPLDVTGAARLLAEGDIRRVPAGFVNGRIFLNNASFGLYRRLLEERETHKQRFGRRRLVALFSALATLLRRHRSYLLHLEMDGQPVDLATLSVFFGRNALQMEQLGLDEALCVARGELAILAPRVVSRLLLLGLLVRGSFGKLETARDLRQYCARRVEVKRLDGRSRRLRIAIDGEVSECTLPLVVESVPDALRVVAPANPKPAR